MLLGQAFFDRPGRDLPPRGEAQLEHDIAYVSLDGSFAQYQGIGDLAVEASLGDLYRNLTFARG